MQFIDNRETLKLELHFDRAEYDALTSDQKGKIKSSYLWSNYGKCWVSRTKYPNHYYADKVARDLGAGEPEKQGERLTMAERLENQAERAETRADRYEEHAANAEKRAEGLQKEFNHLRQDIAWLTQPIIAGHSGSRAFARSRDRVMARYDRGMEEYKKSGYYIDRAETARQTAEQAKLKNAGYLERRIKEQNAIIKKIQQYIVNDENALYKVQNGETVKHFSGDLFTSEELEKAIEKQLERYEFEADKLTFFEDALQSIGGMKYSKENIKAGYIINIGGGIGQVVKANPASLDVKTSCGLVIKYLYGEIREVIKAEEVKPKNETEPQPYKVGEIVTKNRPADDSIYKAYQIVGATDKTVKLRQIALEKGIPQPEQFTGEAITRKPVISRFNGKWTLYEDDWQLHRWQAANA